MNNRIKLDMNIVLNSKESNSPGINIAIWDVSERPASKIEEGALSELPDKTNATRVSPMLLPKPRTEAVVNDFDADGITMCLNITNFDAPNDVADAISLGLTPSIPACETKNIVGNITRDKTMAAANIDNPELDGVYFCNIGTRINKPNTL